MKRSHQQLALLVGAALLGIACEAAPSGSRGAGGGAAGGPGTAGSPPALYAHATRQPLPDDPTPLVVPGAAWLDRDLGPLAEGRRVVFYDLRGRGRSPVMPADAEPRLADDVADLEGLRARLGLERLALLGWAYQGGLAVRYALAHPERVERLVLVAPLPAVAREWGDYRANFALRADPDLFRVIDGMRRDGTKRRNPEGYARMVVEASLQVFLIDPQRAEDMRSDPVVPPNLDPDVTARIGREILGALGDWDWTAELGTLDVPTLIVHGDGGLVPLESAERYATALPRATLLRIPSAGHMPWVEAPEEFFPAVVAFLDDTSSP